MIKYMMIENIDKKNEGVYFDRYKQKGFQKIQNDKKRGQKAKNTEGVYFDRYKTKKISGDTKR